VSECDVWGACGDGVLSDLYVDDHAKMIACPDSVDRLIEGKCGGLNTRMGLGVSVPRTDEHVVDPAAMIGLLDDLVNGITVTVHSID
jgi:hypothetical protein